MSKRKGQGDQRGDVFLLLPVVGKGLTPTDPLDLEALRRSHLTQFFERVGVNKRSGKSDFRPSHGLEAGVLEDLFDPDQLGQTWVQGLNQIRETLRRTMIDCQTKAGEVELDENFPNRLMQLTLEALPLEQIFQQLAAGHPDAADQLLLKAVYHLMGNMVRLLQEVAELQVKANRWQNTAEAQIASVEQRDQVSTDAYLNWAVAAEGVVDTTAHLIELENSMREKDRSREQSRRAFAVQLALEQETLRIAYEFLANSADSFSLRAFDFVAGVRTNAEEMRKDLAMAKEQIERCQAMERGIINAWEQAHAGLRQEQETLTEQNRALIRDFKAHLEQLGRIEETYKGSVLPFVQSDDEIRRGVKPLITKERYEEARRIVAHPNFRPNERQRVLLDLLDRLKDLGKRPRLPEALRIAIHDAQERITTIEGMIESSQLPAIIEKVQAPSKEFSSAAAAPVSGRKKDVRTKRT